MGSWVVVLLLLTACSTPTESSGSRVAAPRRVRAFDWRSLRPAPSARTEVAGAADSQGSIVVAGGFAPDTVDTVEIYDPDLNLWRSGPDLPTAVNHAMAAALGGVVHVFGGYTSGGAPSDQAFALRGDSWEPLPPMPEGRAAGGAAAAGGKVYVAGGVGPTGLATSTLVFDPGAGTWTTAAPLLRPREHLGVAAFGSQVYVVGGRIGGTNLPDAEVLDTRTGVWRSLPDMPTARGGLSATATRNGFIVAPGGEELGQGGTTYPQVEAFDTDAGRWISLPPMPTPRHGLGVVAIGETVYTLHGGPQPGLTFEDTAESMDISGLEEIRCLRGRPTTVGSPRGDRIRGTDQADVLVALGGADAVRGGSGGDRVCGGPGDDRLAGGSGRDVLLGGSGRDRCAEPGPGSRRRGCEH